MKNKKNNWFYLKVMAVGMALLMGIAWLACRGETVPQTQSVLHSYFTTGNRPSQTNYWEFIDTMFWYANHSYSNALAAASAAAAVNSYYFALGNFTLVVSTNITATVNSEYNLASVSVITNGTHTFAVPGAGNETKSIFQITVNLATALSGTNYLLSVSCPTAVGAFDSGGQHTEVIVDGDNNTNLMGYVLTSTNFSFDAFSDSSANLNGLTITCKAH